MLYTYKIIIKKWYSSNALIWDYYYPLIWLNEHLLWTGVTICFKMLDIHCFLWLDNYFTFCDVMLCRWACVCLAEWWEIYLFPGACYMLVGAIGTNKQIVLFHYTQSTGNEYCDLSLLIDDITICLCPKQSKSCKQCMNMNAPSKAKAVNSVWILPLIIHPCW